MIFLVTKYLYDTIKFCYNESICIIIRSIFSFFTSFLFSIIAGYYLIDLFNKHKIQQIIRNCNPKSHANKKNTPTMGGLLIILSIILSTIIWSKLSNPYIIYTIIIFIGYGIIGFIDDYKKLYYKNSNGISYYYKFFLLSIIAIFLILLIYYNINNNSLSKFVFPFSNTIIYKKKIIYILLAYFTIVGTSNAVNLTDGLDGLAIVPVIFITISLSILSFISGNLYYTNYFNIIYIPNINELMIICMSIIGSTLGFLWFNAYPAKIFMGDVGSLSLGGGIGMIAVLLRQEILLSILGGIFVIETLSVIVQIIYFKLSKKRFFKMTPIHHHYELNGAAESQLVIRFWIIAFIFTLIGLITILKVH